MTVENDQQQPCLSLKHFSAVSSILSSLASLLLLLLPSLALLQTSFSPSTAKDQRHWYVSKILSNLKESDQTKKYFFTYRFHALVYTNDIDVAAFKNFGINIVNVIFTYTTWAASPSKVIIITTTCNHRMFLAFIYTYSCQTSHSGNKIQLLQMNKVIVLFYLSKKKKCVPNFPLHLFEINSCQCRIFFFVAKS